MKYEKARAEVIVLDNEDVIRTSDGRCETKQNKQAEGTWCGNKGSANKQDAAMMDPHWLD